MMRTTAAGVAGRMGFMRGSAVVAAGALVLLLGACSDGGQGAEDDPTPSAPTTTEPTESPTPEVDPVVESVPSGTYVVKTRVTEHDGKPYRGKDGRTRNVWTVTPDCDSAEDCGGRIAASPK